VADYSQIELRLVAEVSGDPRMRMIFQTGGDVHAATASEILGIAIEFLTKEQRKMGKPINFGFIYGMWWKKFKDYARDNYGVIFTDPESEAYRTRFFEIFNYLPKWHKRMKRTVQLYGQVESLSGRIRHLPGINSSDKSVQQEAERQAINSPIQGFGSGDLKAMAMIEVDETFDEDQLRIVGEVHDSILMWIKEEPLEEIIPEVKRIMEHPRLFKDFKIELSVPLVADFEVGPWGTGEKWKFAA
jgi:DNA polymerase-1